MKKEEEEMEKKINKLWNEESIEKGLKKSKGVVG